MKRIDIIKAALLAILFGYSALVVSGIPTPNIPKGDGEKCVEPTEDMRKNHMEYILHQRDETVYEGIRTTKHSLKECINCHAVKDDNYMAVTYKDKRHFCNSCHEYASVQIDCFDCHTSVPSEEHSSSNSSPKKISNKKPVGFFNSAMKSPVEN